MIYLRIIFSLLILSMWACQPVEKPAEDVLAEPAAQTVLSYDSLKAQAYGADDYGMKKYVMAFLKRGPNRALDSLKAAELQRAHLQNITRMAEAGQLVLAGPFFGQGEIRGIYIFDVASIAEAEALTHTDPAIQAGSLEMELKEWYGSAALLEVNQIHQSLAKQGITD